MAGTELALEPAAEEEVAGSATADEAAELPELLPPTVTSTL